MTRGFAIVALLSAAYAATGCRAGPAAERLVPVPPGLDSLDRARWLERQRAECSGRLVSVFDEGVFGHDRDSLAHRDTVQYRAVLSGVQCLRPQAVHRDHPRNDKYNTAGP